MSKRIYRDEETGAEIIYRPVRFVWPYRLLARFPFLLPLRFRVRLLGHAFSRAAGRPEKG